MKLKAALRNAGRKIGQHSNAILTGTSIVGVIGTTIFCIGDTKNAQLRIDQLMAERKENGEGEPTRFEKFKAAAPAYVRTAVSGGMTIGMILLNGKLNAKRAATLAGLYTSAQTALGEYQDVVVDKIGKKKEQEIRDEVSERKVKKKEVPPEMSEPAQIEKVLFYDEWSDRYFTGDIETLKQTQNRLNHIIISQMTYVSMAEWYQEVGLKPRKNDRKMIFDVDNMIELDLSTTTYAPNGRPCGVVRFYHDPIDMYRKRT